MKSLLLFIAVTLNATAFGQTSNVERCFEYELPSFANEFQDGYSDLYRIASRSEFNLPAVAQYCFGQKFLVPNAGSLYEATLVGLNPETNQLRVRFDEISYSNWFDRLIMPSDPSPDVEYSPYTLVFSEIPAGQTFTVDKNYVTQRSAFLVGSNDKLMISNRPTSRWKSQTKKIFRTGKAFVNYGLEYTRNSWNSYSSVVKRSGTVYELTQTQITSAIEVFDDTTGEKFYLATVVVSEKSFFSDMNKRLSSAPFKRETKKYRILVERIDAHYGTDLNTQLSSLQNVSSAVICSESTCAVEMAD